MLNTVSYTYGNSDWGDLLTNFNGNTITHDNIGNPLSDGTWTYTWEHGRELASMYGENVNGGENDVSISYEYDADGLRTKKTVTTKTYTTHVHSYTETVVAPTCTDGGYTLYTCECGDNYRDNETQPIDHSYGIRGQTTLPTCTEEGYTTYTCVDCGYSYIGDYVPALGHTYSTTSAYGCTRCGSISTEHSHTPDRTAATEVIAPTCTDDGYTLYTCSGCGEIYQDDFIDKLGHQFVLNPFICDRCGYDNRVSILGLSSENSITTGTNEPTETTNYSVTSGITVQSTESLLISTTTKEYQYVYTGGSLMQMVVKTTTTPAEGTATTTTETLIFTYDASGLPLSVDYNGTDYYYATNIQGDVMAILNTSGTAVVEYTYDAWGNIHEVSGTLADTLGKTNPLRYRGYVYDTDTGYYYLQSRYYDPEVGRFINADAFVSTGTGLLGNNMFAYCNSNPIRFSDPTGLCTYNPILGQWIDCDKWYCPDSKNYIFQTVSLGASGSVTLGPFTYGMQIALVTDSQGYSELQFTYYSPISSSALSGTPSADKMLKQASSIEKITDILSFSLMGNLSFYNAPQAQDLYGTGYQIGGAMGAGKAVAVDYNIIPNNTDNPYSGVTVSMGAGSADFHGTMSITSGVIASPVSVYDLIEAAYNGLWGR